MVLLHRKQLFSKDAREGPTFSRGGPTFLRGGGVQMLISIETHITCDFSSGGGGGGGGGTHCTVYDESCVLILYEGVCDQCITVHIHISENDIS